MRFADKLPKPTLPKPARAVWSRLGKSPRNKPGNWLHVATPGVQAVDNELVSTPYERWLRLGTFVLEARKATDENVVRAVGALGVLAEKYRCTHIQAKIAASPVVRAVGELFGNDNLEITLPAASTGYRGMLLHYTDAAGSLGVLADLQPAAGPPQFWAEVTVDMAKVDTRDWEQPTEVNEPEYH
jgi:hypothetical protein